LPPVVAYLGSEQNWVDHTSTGTKLVPVVASTAAPEKKKCGTLDALRAARKRAEDRTKRK